MRCYIYCQTSPSCCLIYSIPMTRNQHGQHWVPMKLTVRIFLIDLPFSHRFGEINGKGYILTPTAMKPLNWFWRNENLRITSCQQANFRFDPTMWAVSANTKHDRKDQISGVHVSPGSAETLARRVGITNNHLRGYSLSNISVTKIRKSVDVHWSCSVQN